MSVHDGQGKIFQRLERKKEQIPSSKTHEIA